MYTQARKMKTWNEKKEEKKERRVVVKIVDVCVVYAFESSMCYMHVCVCVCEK